jgi:hypothetical protein
VKEINLFILILANESQTHFGASVMELASLLSKDFARLIILSATIAFPVAGYAMAKCLRNYAYRITISWWIFIAAGAAALFIAIPTISYQTAKASFVNPAQSLRSGQANLSMSGSVSFEPEGI